MSIKTSTCKYINNKLETVMLHGDKNDAVGKRQSNSTWSQESCSAFKNEHEESSVVVCMQLCNLSRKRTVSTGNQCLCRGPCASASLAMFKKPETLERFVTHSKHFTLSTLGSIGKLKAPVFSKVLSRDLKVRSGHSGTRHTNM